MIPPPPSDHRVSLLTGGLFSLLVIILSIFTPLFVPQATAGVDQALINKVKYYYDINKNRSNRKYGCNWYRVLIAFGTDPLPSYEGPDGSCSMTAYTSDEAKEGEKVWPYGWTSVREELEDIENSQTVTIEPPKAQRSTQQTLPVVEFIEGEFDFYNRVKIGEKGCVVWGNGGVIGNKNNLNPSKEDLNEIRCNVKLTANTPPNKTFSIGVSVEYPDGSTGGPYYANIRTYNLTYALDLIKLTPNNNIVDSTDTTNYQYPIKIKIYPSSNYQIGTKNEITLIMVDDEPKPKVSVSTSNDKVTEGNNVPFTLTADREAFKPYDVDVEITNSDPIGTGKRVPPVVDEKTYTITIPAGVKTVTFDVPTIDNLIKKNRVNGKAAVDGYVGAQLVDGNNYDIQSPTWLIKDIDDSEKRKQITLTVEMPPDITEGNGGGQKTITPTITLSESVSQDVKITIKGDADVGTARPSNFVSGQPKWSDGSANPTWDYAFQKGIFQGYTKTIEAGNLTLPSPQGMSIHKDDTFEADETIGFVVECTTGCSANDYEIQVVNDSTPTKILNDDASPVFTISTHSDSIIEGNQISVTVTADVAVTIPTIVELNLSDSEYDYVVDRTRDIEFEPEDGTTKITLVTTKPPIPGYQENHGQINLSLGEIYKNGDRSFVTGTKGNPSSKSIDITDSGSVITMVMPDDIEEGHSGAKDLYPKLMLDKALTTTLGICMVGVDKSKDIKWAKPGNGGDNSRDYAFWSGTWDSNLCFNIPAGVTEVTKDTYGNTWRIRVKGDADPESHEKIGIKILCQTDSSEVECGGNKLVQDDTPTQIINDDVRKIAIPGTSYFCRQDSPSSNPYSPRNLRNADFCESPNWEDTREALLTANIVNTPTFKIIERVLWTIFYRETVGNPPQRITVDQLQKDYTIRDTNRKYITNPNWIGYENEYYHALVALTYVESGGDVLVPGTRGYGDYNAKECVIHFKHTSSKGVVCGVNGNRVMIDMPDRAAEDNVYAWIYPSTGATESIELKVTRTKIDKVADKDVFNIDVPPEGLKYTFNVNNSRDERDGDFEFLFKVVGGTNWTINQPDTRKTVYIVDDDPTIIEWTTNTLSEKLDEGGFQRIAKFALFKGDTEATDDKGDFWQASDIMTWDFNLGGDIKLVDAPPRNCLNESDQITCNKSTENGGVALNTMPVYIDLDDSRTNSRSTRLSKLDSFELTGRTAPGNGWVMQMKVGEDVNDIDESMTTDLQITLSQSGGEVIVRDFPNSFVLYDDEKANKTVEDDPNLNDDSVYVSFTRDKYQVSESAGPAQPVITYSNKDNDGNIIKQTTLIDTARIFIKLDESASTATLGSDFYMEQLHDVLLTPGQGHGVAKFDIGMNSYDDDHVDIYKTWLNNGRPGRDNPLYDSSGDETIVLSIDPATLPEGIKIDPNGISKAVVTIINSEQDAVNREKAQAEINKCDPTHADYDADAACDINKPVIEITRINKASIDENGGSIIVFFRNTHSSNILNNQRIKYKLEGSCIQNTDGRNSHDKSTNLTLLNPGSTTNQESFSHYQSIFRPGFLKQGNDSVFTKGDDNDCKVTVSLRDSPHYIIGGSPKTFLVKDVAPTGVFINYGRPISGTDYDNVNDYSEERPLSMAIFLHRSRYFNNLHTSDDDRRLNEGEIIEVPIKARYSNVNKSLTTDDFLITAFEDQNNLTVEELPNKSGYSVKMIYDPSESTTNCRSHPNNNKFKNINHIACLSLSTTMNLKSGSVKNIDVYIDYSDANYGETNLSGGFSDSYHHSGNPGTHISFDIRGFETNVDTTAGSPSDPKSLTLHARQTKIEEPDGDPKIKTSREQPWIDVPIDVVMTPGSSPAGSTGFKFCVVKNDTTASYYYDWRIVDANDSAYNLPVGGFAWNPTEGCTRGSLRAVSKERYYLRVHGDSHDEGEEKIALYLKVSSTNDNVTSATDNQNPVTFTIANDGPLPGNYLSYLGHSIASESVAIIESRIGLTRSPTDIPQIQFGAMPTEDESITDPGKLLEGSSLDFTNSNGLSFYSSYTVSNNSGTGMVSGKNRHITFGIDRKSKTNSKLVYGAMVSSVNSEGSYNGDEYTIDSDMLALVPYIIYDQRYYGALGFGTGEYKHLIDTGETASTNTSWKFLALGVKQQVLEFNDKTSVYLTGDYFYQKIESDKVDGLNSSSNSSYRSRVGFSIDHELADHILISPSLHYRKEGGNITTDKGIDLGFGVDYKDGPWNVNFHYVKTIEMDNNEWESRSLSVSFTQGKTRTYMNTDGEKTGYGVRHQVTDRAHIGVDASDDDSVNGNVGVSW